jgi:hypothetical protein
MFAFWRFVALLFFVIAAFVVLVVTVRAECISPEALRQREAAAEEKRGHKNAFLTLDRREAQLLIDKSLETHGREKQPGHTALGDMVIEISTRFPDRVVIYFFKSDCLVNVIPMRRSYMEQELRNAFGDSLTFSPIVYGTAI